MGSKALFASQAIVKHESDQCFTVMDLILRCKRESLRQRHANDFDVLVVFGLRMAVTDVAGEVDLHPFAEETGARKVFGEQRPSPGTVAGLFNHLAFGRGESGFPGFDATGGEFQQELAGGVTVLALKDDVGVRGIPGFIDGKDDD